MLADELAIGVLGVGAISPAGNGAVLVFVVVVCAVVVGATAEGAS